MSTDEVYGSLGESGLFDEQSPYNPDTPYAASKAAYQYLDNLVPLTILNALKGKSLPVIGKGDQVRDWLYVDDHARALCLVMEQGRAGET